MRATAIGLVSVALLMLASPVALAAEIYTSSVTITAEDLIETETGRKVKDLNDEMRGWAEAADKLDKGSDPYNLIKQKFDELKRERDEVGKNLRGLRGKELVFYGDRANADAYSFKQRFIARWEQEQKVRDFFAGGTVHVSYDKNGRQRVQTTPPRPEDVDSYVAEADTGSQPAGPGTTAPDYSNAIVVTPMVPSGMEDPCAYILGMPNPDPACAGR